MRAERRRLRGCRGCEPQDSSRVAGRLRVVCEPREIAFPGRLFGECCERSAVQLDAPVWRNRLLDCQSRELVAEGRAPALGSEHAGCEALV